MKDEGGKKKYVKPTVESFDFDLNTPFLVASCVPVSNCWPDFCWPIVTCWPDICWPAICRP